MQCNIDEKGARFRAVWGIMVLTVALMLGGLAASTGMWGLWVISGICALAGGFAIFESRKKWCAMRAMGIKTRI